MSVRVPEPQTGPAERPDGIVLPDGVAQAPRAEQVSQTEQPEQPARSRRRLPGRGVLISAAAVVLLIVGVVGYNAYREGLMYVSTENAQLTGQMVQVGALNAGKVDAIFSNIGAAVHKGDVIAQVVLPSQVGTTQSGQPRVDYLGAGDTRIDVKAPFDGVIVATPSAVGSTVAVGQPIVTMVDPTQLWVNANIEETNITRVKVGQPVTVHVDALGQDVPGKVEVVTPATSATFSILPPSNASGNYTKVTQLVPVRISVNLGTHQPLLGANVGVKIKVAD